MINTSFTNPISIGQQAMDKAAAALFKGKPFNANGYEVIVGTLDVMRFIDYNSVQIAVFLPTSMRMLFNLQFIVQHPTIISKYNKLLKHFNLRCGLRDGKPFIKQTSGVAYCYSFTDDVLLIDLRRTKECTSQYLWFMNYC